MDRINGASRAGSRLSRRPDGVILGDRVTEARLGFLVRSLMVLPICDRGCAAPARRSTVNLRAKRWRSRHHPRTLQSRLRLIHLRLRCL